LLGEVVALLLRPDSNGATFLVKLRSDYWRAYFRFLSLSWRC
jgi:hypothetical protein